MPTDTVRIEDFISQNGISMTAIWTDRNPNMEDSANMDHWKCTLHKPQGRSARKGRMTLVFSQGYGHNGKQPELASVLDCLASDAAGIENAGGDFNDWCGEYGYDTDSRKAEKTFKACQHQAARLKTFLGDDLYVQLLWKTERQ